MFANFGYLLIFIIGIPLITLKMPKVKLCDQTRASIFTHREFISLKMGARILLALAGLFTKDLETMLL